jgi:hypothetical protein
MELWFAIMAHIVQIVGRDEKVRIIPLLALR